MPEPVSGTGAQHKHEATYDLGFLVPVGTGARAGSETSQRGFVKPNSDAKLGTLPSKSNSSDSRNSGAQFKAECFTVTMEEAGFDAAFVPHLCFLLFCRLTAGDQAVAGSVAKAAADTEEM